MGKKFKFFFALALFLSAVICAVRWRETVTFVDRTCGVLAYPFLVIQDSITHELELIHNWRVSINELNARIQTLQEEKSALTKQLIECHALTTYTQAIEPLIAFKNRYKLEHARPVHVILTHLQKDENYILVEGGQDCNFTDEFIAIKDHHLVGRVMQVYPHYSKIVLITDKRINVASYCSKTKSMGIHSGTNISGVGALQFVNHMQPLVNGDLVLSSGQGHVFPQGFCLGRIVFLNKKEFEYEVRTAPLINLKELSYCLLVHPDDLHKKVESNQTKQEAVKPAGASSIKAKAVTKSVQTKNVSSQEPTSAGPVVHTQEQTATASCAPAPAQLPTQSPAQ